MRTKAAIETMVRSDMTILPQTSHIERNAFDHLRFRGDPVP
jgi:hypothetical protein